MTRNKLCFEVKEVIYEYRFQVQNNGVYVCVYATFMAGLCRLSLLLKCIESKVSDATGNGPMQPRLTKDLHRAAMFCVSQAGMDSRRNKVAGQVYVDTMIFGLSSSGKDLP